MAATKKSQVIVRVLAEKLALRTGLAVATGVDSNQNPYILIGDGVAGHQCAYIMVKQDYDPALEVDGIGNTQRRYTPHVMSVVIEAGSLGTGVGDITALTVANWAKILKECVEVGTKVAVYEVANGTAITAANGATGIAAGNLKVTLDSLINPLLETI